MPNNAMIQVLVVLPDLCQSVDTIVHGNLPVSGFQEFVSPWIASIKPM